MSLMFAKVALSVRSSLANVAKRSFHCTSKNLGKFLLDILLINYLRAWGVNHLFHNLVLFY